MRKRRKVNTVTDYPTTIRVCNVDLQRRDPGHNDAYYSALIGPVHVALRTKDGHWWAEVTPPGWLVMPQRKTGPLCQADAIKAAEREATKCLEAMGVAATNLEAAQAWRGALRASEQTQIAGICSACKTAVECGDSMRFNLPWSAPNALAWRCLNSRCQHKLPVTTPFDAVPLWVEVSG